MHDVDVPFKQRSLDLLRLRMSKRNDARHVAGLKRSHRLKPSPDQFPMQKLHEGVRMVLNCGDANSLYNF